MDSEAHDLNQATVVVTGATRGFGRATALAALAAGARRVVGIARSRGGLDEFAKAAGDAFTPVVGDVADPGLAKFVIDEFTPDIVVLNAGVTPTMCPIDEHSWETFSEAWNIDVAHAFHWTQAALARPLSPGSSVIAMSSMAAVKGSPLSGGYAGAKAAVRWIASYAAKESVARGLDVQFTAVLPGLTPSTGVGHSGASAYAARAGIDLATFTASLGQVLSPDSVAAGVLAIATGATPPADAFTFDGDRLVALT